MKDTFIWDKKKVWGQLNKLAESKQKGYRIFSVLSKHIKDPKQRTILWRIQKCWGFVEATTCLDSGYSQITRGNFCKYYKYCPNCARRRAIQQINKLRQHIKKIWYENKNFYYIVLTIRHGKQDKLKDLLEKLFGYKDQIRTRYNNGKREVQKTKSFFCKFEGMIYSIEIADDRGGRHPHINILACTDEEITLNQREAKAKSGKKKLESVNWDLRKEWESITGDSKITYINKIDIRNEGDIETKRGLYEVFKYSTKFSSIKNCRLVEYYETFQALKNKNLISATGCFWGMGKIKKEKLQPKDETKVVKSILRYRTNIQGYKLIRRE